ncbi:MAG TPA: TonB family protein [bacterium]|nr:TonB family protein [bacterium]
MKRPSVSNIGIVISIVFHLLLASVPFTMAASYKSQIDEKKVSLVFEKPKPPPPPKPRPEPPPPRPRKKLPPKPVPKPEPPPPEPEPETPKLPIEAEVADAGGIDIPTGPAYEEIYVPPPEPEPVYVPVCGNGIKDPGEECDGGSYCSSLCMVIPVCGNGVVERGEECDGGRACAGDCSLIDLDAVMLGYKKSVAAIVARNKYYPPWAREEGFEGAAVMSFTIAANGSVSDIRVAHSSDFDVLDDGAITTIRNCGVFPPIPAELGMELMKISVSIVFRLD